MIRENITDPWREVSWDEALTYAATKLNAIRDQHGPGALGGITSSRCTNEETFLVQKLIRAGFKVAVCEQMEDPGEAKKRGSKSVVARDVVRLVTPGTLTEDSLLEARRHNFLAAFAVVREDSALAWVDISTGALRVAPCPLPRLAPAALERLSQYHWPGNVRQLENVLFQAVSLTARILTLTTAAGRERSSPHA